jgi:hypothetical protein
MQIESPLVKFLWVADPILGPNTSLIQIKEVHDNKEGS